MQRDVAALRRGEYDLLVVGAGVYGAALALEAALSGKRVAIVDAQDLVSGASSNSMKILHGGLRYLQQFDIGRMRESIRARRAWAQFSPDLVRPLECLIATRGVGVRSPLALRIALMANDAISFDRNDGLDRQCHLGRGRLVAGIEYRHLTEGLGAHGSTTGALWWDTQALDTERLVIRLIDEAARLGAVVANYVEVERPVLSGGRVRGVEAVDCESGMRFDIGAARVVVAAGGGVGRFLTEAGGARRIQPAWCAAVNIVVRRRLPGNVALALQTRAEPVGARGLGTSATRELFLVPWCGRTIVGTHYVPAEPHGSDTELRRAACLELLRMASQAAPQLSLSESDISFSHWGYLPLARIGEKPGPLVLDSKARLTDCADGLSARGLWTLTGPKFTTAREVAKGVLNRVFETRQFRNVMRLAPVAGEFDSKMPKCTDVVGGASAATLVEAGRIAADHGMALHLADAVLRRTGIGSAGHPGTAALEACGRGMQQALGWTQQELDREIAAVNAIYRNLHFSNGRDCSSAEEYDT